MSECILVTLLSFLLQWESDCQQHVDAAQSLARNRIGILVTTRPGWLPRNVYQMVGRLGISQRPALAEIYVNISDDGNVQVQGEDVTVDEAKVKLIQLRKKISRVAGTSNVHVLFAVSDYPNVGLENTSYRKLSEFVRSSELRSGSRIKASRVSARIENLDPRNLMGRKAE